MLKLPDNSFSLSSHSLPSFFFVFLTIMYAVLYLSNHALCRPFIEEESACMSMDQPGIDSLCSPWDPSGNWIRIRGAQSLAVESNHLGGIANKTISAV